MRRATSGQFTVMLILAVLYAVGLTVSRLIRVSYGPFQLGDLPAGAVMEVKTRALREQLGERLATMAGADFSGPMVERETGPPTQTSRRHPEVRTKKISKNGGERRSQVEGKPHRPMNKNKRRR